MRERKGNVVGFRSKLSGKNINDLEQRNPHTPDKKTIAGFMLPPGMDILRIKDVADTIDLASLGIVIPNCKYPDRFEAGVRYGLAHNRRTDVKTQFRPLFSRGFCWAKMYYRKLAPTHPLAASGSHKMKIIIVDEYPH